jgi:hypothetical protein
MTLAAWTRLDANEIVALLGSVWITPEKSDNRTCGGLVLHMDGKGESPLRWV